MTLTLQPLSQTTLNHFYRLAMEHEDEKVQMKLIDLYEKHLKDEFVITFAGHFSAGKSSLINQLLKEEILPKSPIPTSANIVKIKAGSGAAHVYFNDDKIVRYKAPYDIDKIKNFCMDKSNIYQIELTTLNHHLPKGITLIDTPGIDAADDYDRELTEASLHLTDVLFYVMDYNHVQSEVNLQFLQQLQTYNIPFYIIVNQIDKHIATEICFTDYETLVKQTFIDWNLKPLHIFFTSLKDFSLPHNEFSQLVETIFNVKDHIIIDRNRSLNHLIKEHEQFIKTSYEQKIETVAMTKEEQNAYKKAQRLHKTIEQYKARLHMLKQSLETELRHSLNNAYLMPFETREHARLFLEAYEANFKIGFFRSKQKTERERTERLKTLYAAIIKTINSSLLWNLREKLQRIAEEYELNDSMIQATIQSLSIQFTKDHLVDLMHPGATVNGQYILNYTNQITETIKQLFRQSFNHLWEQIELLLLDKINEKLSIYETYEKHIKTYEQKQQTIRKIEQTYSKQLSQLEKVANRDGRIKDYLGQIYAERKIYDHDQLTELDLNVKKFAEEKVDMVEYSAEDPHLETLGDVDVVAKIDQTIDIIQDLPSFTHIVNDLADKKKRLVNRKVTVALFGAFSAGKSSFANALIGKQLLPSSPNPTTAAITKIHPVTNENPHGTIIVTFKDEAHMMKDLRIMLKDYGPPETTLELLIKWIKEKNILQEQSLNHRTQVYIESLVTGYETMQPYLGQQTTVSLSIFHELATVEKKACFVDTIDLYYASDLTNKGITLVDTPGADSIHTRHTDVSFNFIKNADVLIYVTYYNHAFAKADREFITQLGRVKETFELDKMFFIVNAADLAEDEAELKIVVNHVKEELLHLGVRLANIFPVSSKRSIANRVNNEPLNQQMRTFERAFYRFIEHDLTKLMTDAAQVDMFRTKQLLNQYIEKASLDASKKEQQKRFLIDTKIKLLKAINDERADIYEQQLLERIKRQLHYVGERFKINFHDLFGENFNPTTISSEQQTELENCLDELMNDIRFELLQEMRAVSLRIEAMIRKLTMDLYDDYQKTLQTIEQQMTLPLYTTIPIRSPIFKEGLNNIDKRSLNQSLRLFKNKRLFFEKRQSEQMKQSLYEKLMPYIKQYITVHKELMIDFYKHQWKESCAHLNKFSTNVIDQYINHQNTMLVEEIDIQILQTKAKQLANILEEDVK